MCSSRPVSCEKPIFDRRDSSKNRSIKHARRDADASSSSFLLFDAHASRKTSCRSFLRRLYLAASLRSKRFSGITTCIGRCMIEACRRTSYGIVSASPSLGFCSIPWCSPANGFSFEEEALFGYPPKIVHTALIPIRTRQGVLPNSTKKGRCSGKLCLLSLLPFVCVSAWQWIFFCLYFFCLCIPYHVFRFLCICNILFVFSLLFFVYLLFLSSLPLMFFPSMLSLLFLGLLCFVGFLVFVNLFCLFCLSVSRSLRFVGLFCFVLFSSIASLLFRSLSVSSVSRSLLSLLSFFSVSHVLFVYAVSSLCCFCLSVSSVSLSRSVLGLFRFVLFCLLLSMLSLLSLCLSVSSVQA